MSSSWKKGHDIIAGLVKQHHLERVSGAAANGQALLDHARQRLTGAEAAATADPIGAYTLAYDAARQAATALLTQQGLRPKSQGGHIAIVEAVTAQFGPVFEQLNRMRRTRNHLEYPGSAEDLDLGAEEADEAITVAEELIDAADALLPQLGIWQP